MRLKLLLMIALLLPFNAQAATILNPFMVAAASSPPANSLSFTSASSQYLKMTNSNFGTINRDKFSVSLWFKRASTGGVRGLYSQWGYGGDRCFYIRFTNANKINIATSSGGSAADGELLTTATYTSTSAWYHLVFHFDGQNATAGDRMRLWIDGTEVTAFDTDTNPPQAAIATPTNAFSSDFMMVGNSSFADTYVFDGLIYQAALYSGTLVTASTVYNSGVPKGITTDTGIYSHLDGISAVSDTLLTPDWTNVNTVTTSATIP